MKRLEGKSIVVTAAAQGIGRASVLAMAAEGAHVWATDVNGAVLRSLAGTAGIETAVLDVLDQSAIQAMAAQTGPIDVLFNCSGIVHNDTVLKARDEDLDFAFRLNVRAHMHMIQAFLPGMLTKGGGSIINMASVASSVKGLPSRCVYGTTKAAVIGLTKSVAADYVGQGVRCNAICPGTVDTPSLADRINAYEDPVAARKAFVARQPMGRLAQAEEIAPLLVFLASDESRFVTGQAYSIDGGMTI
ncbi:MAG: SDR family oxidoreductase [Betaproteobacteria bacterium]|jgi:2-keto-3-deoxy-L-fuconate dehydrogenase|nr:SDR family oxidoreductase [Betaproteobacteria bacterium]